jgi:hypothetical protein
MHYAYTDVLFRKTQCKMRAGQPQPPGVRETGVQGAQILSSPLWSSVSTSSSVTSRPRSQVATYAILSFRALVLNPCPRAELRMSAPPPFPCTGLDGSAAHEPAVALRNWTVSIDRLSSIGPSSMSHDNSVAVAGDGDGVVWRAAHGHVHGLAWDGKQLATHGGGARGRVTSDRTAREGIGATTATPTHARQTHARVVFCVRSLQAGRGRSRELVKSRGGC